jgi:hypothetical protein
LINKIWWKIVEHDKITGAYKTLFHGLNGSRTVPKDVWLTAVEKMVKDGTSKTSYLSGFHILESKEDCEEYLKYFTTEKNRVIVPCLARGNIRSKSHSRHPVFLAEKIKLLSDTRTERIYENVLLNLIESKKNDIKLAKRKIEMLELRNQRTHSSSNKRIIETVEKLIEKKKNEIETVWVCLIHYRSLIGVTNED